MASTQQHQRLVHDAEVTSGGEGLMSVRINSSNKPHKRQQQGPSSKPFKYSISSSCSSGEPGSRRGTVTALRDRRKFPPLFERSAARFWDPRFDSPILEEACQERCFPRTQRRLRYVLLYLATAGLLWGAYFGANGARCNLAAFLVPTAAFLLFCLLLFLFTFTRPYTQFHSEASLLLVAVTFTLTLAPQMQAGVGAMGGGNFSVIHATAPCISPVGTFSMCVEVLLLLYGVLHVRLFACVLLGLGYSALFEALGWMGLGLEALSWLAPAKVLLHLCAHAIGVHLFITSEARSRSTFLKVGQAVMHGKDLEVEKALKERMIHSVMPRRVADELMKQGDEEIENVAAAAAAAAASSSCSSSSSSSPKNNKRKKTSIPRGRIIFRPFNMKRMEHVSILFADIVGFTKMSANKSAPALVGLLNDLFGRFDRLCELTNCEKISTLGDCYYCVAGCPEPRSDHAYCCVEMGLGMIQAIERFCRETGETVDMRVGVHTGTVLCGILGMKRFKFDVWSNDVNLANLMEQLGMAGKVHLSEATAGFLDDRYRCEDGRVAERVGQSVVADQLKGLKTYLISGRMIDHTECSCSQLGLTGLDTVDRLSPAPCIHDVSCCNAGDHATYTAPGASGVLCGPHKAKWPCIACKAVDRIPEEGAVQNGGQDEFRTHSDKVSLSQSPKGLNGLLSPPSQGEAVTNSQTSLCEILEDKDKFSAGGGGDHSTLIPNRSKGFRMKNDAHFVEVIKEDSLMNDYFFNPPINKLSLNFLEKSLESAYRTSYQEEVETQADVQTFASPTFSTFLDVSLSCAIFLALTLACFLRSLVIGEPPPATAVAFAVLAGLLGAISLALSIRMAFYMDSTLSFTWILLRTASGWVPRHMIGAVLVSLPAMSIFTHVTCSQHLPVQFATFLCCAVAIAIVQYSNFCQLSFWMRSCLATIVGAMLLFLLYSPLCREKPSNLTEIGIELDSTPELKPAWAPLVQDLLGLEVVLAFFLLLLLVWFLNRDFEVGYRLHYHGNVEADRHRIKIQNMRDQADWLLGNIIPLHVADQLKVTQSYSKNHDDVGVIFASIVNFSEFYEESYEGGKECYRVLNELIGDFDELLRRPPFRHVEKIKTIGATYMAASGLDAQQRRDPADPHAHLRALFDFALEMMRVVEDFNKNMLGFQFKLRVGFNHGPLTAGVIGTTKLLYDIWGDTVNIASRMDTTGVECCVQVSEGSSAALSQLGYDLEYRGTVNVKGKGQMRTFLFLGTAQGGAGLRHSTGNALETSEGRKGAIMGPGLVQEVSVAGTGPVFTCPEPHKSLQRQEKEEANELTKLKVVEDL